MENQNQQRPPGLLSFGPGMKLWLFISLGFACEGIFQLAARSSSLAWLTATGPENNYPVYLGWIAYSIYALVAFALPAIVFANVFPQERFAWFRLEKKINPLVILFGILAMATALFGFAQIADWCNNLITDPDIKAIQTATDKIETWKMQMPGSTDLFFCLFANALIPAVCEELFFRAGIQQLFSEWTKKIHLSVFLSALFFSLLHFDPAGFPVIFVAGMMLGYAFYWTGSLRINILMHFMFNAFSILVSYFNQHSPAVAAWNPTITFSMSGLVLSAVFMFLVWKKSRQTIV